MSPASTALRRSGGRINNAKLENNLGGADSGQVAGTTINFPANHPVPVGQVVVVRSSSDYTSSNPSCTDSKGNTYTILRSAPNGTILRSTLFASAVTTALTGSDRITVTYSASVTNRAAIADAYSGVKIPLNSGNAGGSGSGTSPATSLAVPVGASLVLGLVGFQRPSSESYIEDPTWHGLPLAGTQSGTTPFVSVGGAYQLLRATNTARYRPTLLNSALWVDLMAYLEAA